MAGADDDRHSGRVLFEFAPLGQQMRVAAIDEATGIEVVLIAPLKASRHQMQQQALAKLRRRLGATEPPDKPGRTGRYA